MRRTLFGTKLSSACVALLLVIVGGALAGPWLAPWPADEIDWDAIDQAPNAVHWFGTDGVGRDLFARTLEGARTSLAIAALATLVSTLIGIPWVPPPAIWAARWIKP